MVLAVLLYLVSLGTFYLLPGVRHQSALTTVAATVEILVRAGMLIHDPCCGLNGLVRRVLVRGSDHSLLDYARHLLVLYTLVLVVGYG